MKKGQLIVLSGPSGVGKSTVIAQLLEKRPELYFSVSYTTRKPREGEVDGVNYNFVSREEFQRMIKDQELLEFAEYVNNYYGTSLKVIRDHLEHGVDVLLDIEVQGAAKVRSKCPEALLIFLVPPSFQALSQRLHARNTDSEEVIAGRLEQARREFRQIPNYDYMVVNDRVEDAVRALEEILNASQYRVENQRDLLANLI